MLKQTDVEGILENCDALINQITAGLSAEGQSFSCILSLPLRLWRRPHHADESDLLIHLHLSKGKYHMFEIMSVTN